MERATHGDGREPWQLQLAEIVGNAASHELQNVFIDELPKKRILVSEKGLTTLRLIRTSSGVWTCDFGRVEANTPLNIGDTTFVSNFNDTTLGAPAHNLTNVINIRWPDLATMK